MSNLNLKSAGGGGVILSPESTGVDVTVMVPATASTLLTREDAVWNVKWSGAVGDGVTDDTAAIQAALVSGATSIYFPAGTYLITAKIHLPSTGGVMLHGDGRSSILYFDGVAAGSGEIYLGNAYAGATYTSSGVVIENMSFKGSYTTPNVTPAGATTFGIKFLNTVNDLTITGCYFSNSVSYSCQVLDGTNVKISDNQFFRGHRAAMALGSATSNYVRQFSITGNIIEEMVNTSVDADGILLAGAQYGSVTGNTLYTVSSTGIKLGVADYVQVSGNKLRKVVDGIKVQNGGTFNNIVGNNINQCCRGVAVLGVGTGYTFSHINIADNVIEDCTDATNWVVTEYGATAPGSNYGINCSADATSVFNYLSITNNQISNAARGVSLATAIYNYAFVSGNQGRDGVSLGYTYTDSVVASSTIFQDNQLAGSRDFPFAQEKWIRYLLLGGASDSSTNRRKITTGSAIPATGTWALGDIVFNNSFSSTNTVTFWYCSTAGTPGTWIAGGWFNAKGTTAQRPTPGALDRVTYLDTTLAANGKPIWWTGTLWVDALGAAV